MLDEESERLTKKEVECCNLQARAIIVLARCDFVAASLTTLLWPLIGHWPSTLASDWLRASLNLHSLSWAEGDCRVARRKGKKLLWLSAETDVY